jgi:hypothetical protein
MTRLKRTRPDLIEKFNQQIRLLEKAALRYDTGDKDLVDICH